MSDDPEVIQEVAKDLLWYVEAGQKTGQPQQGSAVRLRLKPPCANEYRNYLLTCLHVVCRLRNTADGVKCEPLPVIRCWREGATYDPDYAFMAKVSELTAVSTTVKTLDAHNDWVLLELVDCDLQMNDPIAIADVEDTTDREFTAVGYAGGASKFSPVSSGSKERRVHYTASWDLRRDTFGESFLRFTGSDTASGMSGGPVLKHTGELVGLHRASQAQWITRESTRVQSVINLLVEAGCEFLEQAVSKLKTRNGSAPVKVAFPLHGIRTQGAWVRTAADTLAEPGEGGAGGWRCQLDGWDYGWFGLLKFLTPWSRSSKVEWFRERYSRAIDDRQVAVDTSSNQYPSIIAHSFGTYILGYALLKYEHIRFNKVILVGAILPRDFPWNALRDRGQIQAVRNEYGGDDLWTVCSSWFVLGTGASGTKGFLELTFPTTNDSFEQKEFALYQHSSYFDRLHIREHWRPFLEKEVESSSPSAGPEPLTLKRPGGDRPTTQWLTLSLLWTLLLLPCSVALYKWSHPTNLLPAVTNQIKAKAAVRRLCLAQDPTDRTREKNQLKGEVVEWSATVTAVKSDDTGPYLQLNVTPEWRPTDSQTECLWLVRAYLDVPDEAAVNYEAKAVTVRGEVNAIIDAGGANLIMLLPARVIDE